MGLRYRRRGTKLRRLEVQNRWLEWTDVMNADLTWRRLIFGMSDNELKFTLQAITNTAPTPDISITYVDGTVHRLTAVAPSVVAHVLFVTS